MRVTVTISAEIDPEPYRGMDYADILEKVNSDISILDLANDGTTVMTWDVED